MYAEAGDGKFSTPFGIKPGRKLTRFEYLVGTLPLSLDFRVGLFLDNYRTH